VAAATTFRKSVRSGMARLLGFARFRKSTSPRLPFVGIYGRLNSSKGVPSGILSARQGGGKRRDLSATAERPETQPA
jgi:hypothetical protein